MRHPVWLTIAVALAAPLAAQTPDSGVAGDSARLESLRQEVQQRYNARAHELLGLNAGQAARFDSVQDRAWTERRGLMLQRRRVNQALRDQLRPGVAANADSVSKLLDARRRANQQLTAVDDKEDRQLAAFLTPVQRAQYQEFRGGFRERVGEAFRHGGMRPGGMRPRAGAPGPRRRP